MDKIRLRGQLNDILYTLLLISNTPNLNNDFWITVLRASNNIKKKI